MTNIWQLYLITGVLLVFGLGSPSTGAVDDESCKRIEEGATRHCHKKCSSDSDCVSTKKKCLCDGECGKTCINPNQRCRGLNTNIDNGRVDIIPFNKFGALATYKCNDGYNVQGKSHRVCQGDGTWRGEEPRCVLNTNIKDQECHKPPFVHHAQHTGGAKDRFPLGTMLKYHCMEDFSAPVGSIDTAWCVGGGVWVGPNMTCAHAGCPLLKGIPFGAVEIVPPNMIGSKARYSCVPGYSLAGRLERICLPDGTWDGEPPTCEKIACGLPPEFPHATHNALRGQTSFPAGHTVEYDCEYGFYKEGFPKAMCSEEGEWIGPRLTCSARSCGYPGDVLNGWREGYIYSYSNRVTYHCNQGYELLGSPHRVCSASGEWSGSIPICQPVSCGPLRVPDYGTISPMGAKFTYGSEVTVTCMESFRVIGSSKRRCQADGTWSGIEPVCKEINCGRPPPLWNGYLDGHKTDVGSVFFFRCNVRTVFDGPSFSTQCQENGEWSHPLPTCWGQCQVPAIANGTVVKGREAVWVDHTTEIKFECHHGLVLNDTSPVRCNNGTWTLIPRCRPSPCVHPPPRVANGRRVFFGQEHGDRARYSCLVGHQLTGRFLRCHYGKWVGQKPSCTEAYCPNPGTLPNGQIYKKGSIGRFKFEKYITTIRHGHKLEYECKRGYKRVGPSGSTCVNSEWSPKEKPLCVLETFHACISEASQVRGAAFMGNNSYMLFFDSTMQMFKLTDQVLYAVECPIKLTDYFLNWPGPPQAVFRSDALLATGPFYVVHDNKVHQYVSTGTQAFPSMFSPWPLHIFDFFNVSISGNVTAVFTTGDRFYACTDDGIYVSKYESFVKLLPVSGIPEFSLSDVTAVATETGLDSLLIFIDNTYYLFDFTGNTVYGRGKVCTNL
ncbi:protein lev-9-like isoform X2 [Liolophura sinensis]|uniref:protein lev-9-like isoform X2 n=1 Tax=Liolophura sinensis TaxID=3198878 RepID=UPI0031596DAA